MSSRRTPTVFIVDDDPPTRLAIHSMLRSVGYEVETFGSGAEFLERAQLGISGCVILDVRMRGLSGLEVQRRLTALGSNAPVIVITGHADIAMAVSAMKAHAVEFLTKPFRDQDLLDAVSAAMDLHRAQSNVSLQREEAMRRLRCLSPRELDVFRMLRQGKLGKQIAFELGISEATVKVHKHNMLHKLEVQNFNQMLVAFGPYTFEDEFILEPK